MHDANRPTSNRALLIWATTATLAAVVFGNVSLLLWVRLHAARDTANQHVTSGRAIAASGQANGAAGAFQGLQDREVSGRYRFFEDGAEVGTIRLLSDHRMVNKDGTIYKQYHWEIQPDGIMTVWQRASILFDEMEKPGVYIARRGGKEYRRIEKME